MPVSQALLSYHEANRYTVIFADITGKREHVKNVIAMAKAIAIAQHSNVDLELLEVLAEHHDDGRADQFKLLGKFWDTEVTHNALGADRVDRYFIKNGAKQDSQVKILKDVMLWHGRKWLKDGIDDETMKYIDIITAADDFENATACVSYLVSEKEKDAKGYSKENPEADQTIVSNFVWDHFTAGEKFDKMKYCHTYAEYTLFASTLGMMCIKQYGNIAQTALMQPGYGYPSILEGFRDVFAKVLRPDDAKKAFSILEKAVKG